MTNRLAAISLVLLALVVLGAACPGEASAAATPTVGRAQQEKLKKRKKIRSVLRKGGLARLPSVSQALAGQDTAAGIRAAAVSGTPPTLLSIPDLNVANLFWQPGVVDAIIAGAPSQSQCSQFWAGSQDGESGGLGACHMAENVGYSFGNILSGETSLCYMKTFPTADNVAAGAVALVGGAFPGGDPARLFSVPGGSRARIVKVNVSGQEHGAESVFLRVFSGAENRVAGDLYAVDLWFCAQGGTEPRGSNRIRIAGSGQYTFAEQSAEGEEAYLSSVSGFVSFDDGRLTYDTTRSRRAETASSRPDGSFKADHVINSDDTITSKSLSSSDWGTRRSYVISSFGGTSLDTLRFLAGAFKEQHESPGGGPNNTFTGSVEFRSTFYAASPGSALEDGLAAVDVATDDFYATPPSTTIDVSGFSCSEVPDVEVSIDFTHPAAQVVQQTCEQRLWERMSFCYDDPAVQAAEMAFHTTCSGPH